MREHSLLMFIFLVTDERHSDFKEVELELGKKINS